MITDYSEITATLNHKRVHLDNHLERKEWMKALKVIHELKKDFAHLHDYVYEQIENVPRQI